MVRAKGSWVQGLLTKFPILTCQRAFRGSRNSPYTPPHLSLSLSKKEILTFLSTSPFFVFIVTPFFRQRLFHFQPFQVTKQCLLCDFPKIALTACLAKYYHSFNGQETNFVFNFFFCVHRKRSFLFSYQFFSVFY